MHASSVLRKIFNNAAAVIMTAIDLLFNWIIVRPRQICTPLAAIASISSDDFRMQTCAGVEFNVFSNCVINNGLLRILQQLRPNGNIMVFANYRGELPSSNAVNKALRKLMSKSGLNKAGYHFHSLCHSHVAYLLSKDVDLYAISKRLGHSSMTITATRYAYLIDELREKEDEKISKVIGRLS